MERTDRARRTHVLETVERGTCQDTERYQPSKAHSPTGDGRGRDFSGHGRKQTEQGTLTLCRRQMEGIIRTQKETDRARHTHFLEKAEGETCQDTERNRRARHTHVLKMAEGGTCQDTERNQPSEVHSQTGGSRGRDLSGHEKKPIE